MASLVKRTRHHILKPLLRYMRGFVPQKDLLVFESEVGIKYRYGRFNSHQFSEYVLQDLPFSQANITFADLVMPPDLLRNQHTHCSKPILQSPHYQLIKELAQETLTPNSVYITLAASGTLDARLPQSAKLSYLYNTFQTRQTELWQGKTLVIYVTPIILHEKLVYVIADGKHRAALCAYYKRPESLFLRVISNEFVKDPFFNEVYSYTLKMTPTEYSINQEMIKMIKAYQHEYQVTRNRR